MSLKTSEQIERLARYTRTQVWCVLGILLMAGAAVAIDAFVPKASIPDVPSWLMTAIGLLVYLLGKRTLSGVDFSSASPAWQAVQHDELRRHARAKAFRNGFFVMLVYPPLCAMTVPKLGVADPLGAVVVGGGWLGLVVFVASLLWYDR